jgi:hypothetical protein
MRETERERVGESEMRKRRFEGRKLEGGMPRCGRSFVLVNIESYEYTPPPLLVFMQGGHMSLTRFGGHWGRSASKTYNTKYTHPHTPKGSPVHSQISVTLKHVHGRTRIFFRRMRRICIPNTQLPVT